MIKKLRPESSNREFRDKVQSNVHNAAETYGREFAIMYDISGVKSSSEFENLKSELLIIIII